MNVSLTPELERLIQDRVKSGRYRSASEVVREALRLLEDRDEVRSLRLQETREKILAGLSSLDQGRAIGGEAAFDELIGGLKPEPSRSR